VLNDVLGRRLVLLLVRDHLLWGSAVGRLVLVLLVLLLVPVALGLVSLGLLLVAVVALLKRRRRRGRVWLRRRLVPRPGRSGLVSLLIEPGARA
jgi:hypothetical protein